MKIRHVAKVMNSNVDKVTLADEVPVRLCNYVDVYKNDYIEANMPFMTASATLAELRKFRLCLGDVIITKDSEDRLDIGVPALVRSTAKDLVCGYHLSLLRPDKQKIRGDYLFWALQSQRTRDAFSNVTYGITRFGLSVGGIKNITIRWPSLDIQKSIADFLDRRTASIDRLIAKKQRFVDLASRRVDGLVDRAISDQLASWIRFEHAVRRVYRPVVLSDHDALVRLGLYNRGRGVFKKPAADEEGMGDSDFFFVKTGDLILSGQFAWEGAVALATKIEDGCVVSHRYPIYRGKDGVSTAYLLGLLRSNLGNFILNESSQGSAGRNRPLNTWRLRKAEDTDP